MDKIELKLKHKIMSYCLAILFVSPLLNFCNIKENTGNKKNWEKQRKKMVQVLRNYGIKNKRILAAMSKVQRHLFIPEPYRQRYNPYGNHPCPIGNSQTISQPYIVAYMTERLNLKPGEKILEIGTGSGYQSAVLAEMGMKVYSIEIVKELANHASRVLKSQGYEKVQILKGNGYQGWPQNAPFDAIIITCAPKKIPESLVKQLKEGGRMIVPVGTFFQKLVIIKKEKGEIIKENDLSVRFVPMVNREKNK